MENKSKLTLIVDGNWLLMSRLAVLNNRFEEESKMVDELKLMLVKSINIVLKTFPSIDNVMFVTDGGSWRNKLEIPSFLQKDEIEYKGNREKSSEINWDLVFGGYEDLQNIMIENNINCYHELGIEGDDWAWYWSTKLNSENTNVIIWTSDRDLTQLVHTNNDGCFTCWWNKKQGAIFQEKESDELNFLFNNIYNANDTIMQEVVKYSSSVKYIDPSRVVIDKIIRGDVGDNILPIITRKSKTNPDKHFRVKQKEIDETLDIYNKNEVSNYVDNLINSKSYIGLIDQSKDQIMAHFDYNVKLVTLAKSSYPFDILNIFERYKTYNKSNDFTIVENVLEANKNDVNKLIDDLF